MTQFELVRASGAFPWHVIDESGIPHVELTLYACRAQEHHSPKTAQSYIRQLTAFASWAASDEIARRQHWTMSGDAGEVRALVSHFLVSQMKCIVLLKQDKLGFETKRIQTQWGQQHRSLPHLLAALSSYYRVMHRLGRYGAQNPMQGDNAKQLITLEQKRIIEEFKRSMGRSPMPAVSGIDNIKVRRPTASYFRMAQGDWVPKVIDDPSLRDDVLSAGREWGWSARELAIAMILFDAGCRIHEVCSITIADWQFSRFGKEIRVINKGSRGQRTKTLYLSDPTVMVLHKYLHEIRSQLDPKRRSFNGLLDMPLKEASHAPLFMTAQRTAVSADYFRRYFWTPALVERGIKIRPHQIRHWFVTMAIQHINETSSTYEQKSNARLTLRELMSWKSDMLPVYDQAIRGLHLPHFAHQVHRSIEERQQALPIQSQSKGKSELVKSEVTSMLDEMLEDGC